MFGQASVGSQLNFTFDLNGNAEWQFCEANRAACVSPPFLPEHADDEVSEAVDDRRLAYEAGG